MRLVSSHKPGGLGLISRKDGVNRSLPILPTLKKNHGAVIQSKTLYKEWINMLKNMQEYAKKQKETKGVFIPEVMLQNLPITTAALLAQIVYWHLPAENGESKLRVKKINKETGEITYWIAKKRDEWKSECGITPREYDKAIKQLTDLGLVETKLFRFSGAVMTHVRLLEQNFLKVYDDWAQTQETSRFDEKCKIGEENKTPGNPDFTKNVKSDKPSNDADLTKNVKSDFTQNVNSNLRKVLNQNLRKSEPLNRDYITENTNKEYPYYIKGGTASLSGSACPPAISNTNDGIPGDVDANSKVGLSLPSLEKDNAVSDREHTPVENTIVVAPSGNTDRNNDGIKQREQSLPGSPTQHGINNNSTAASTQKLPEEKKEKTLREWLAANCRIQWIIDAVLTKLDGNQIMPREHTTDWDAMMQQVAAALPTLRDVLAKCGIHPSNITTLERFCRDKNKPLTASTVIGTLCGPSAKDKLMVYIIAEDYIK
jgi:hypothetical protein